MTTTKARANTNGAQLKSSADLPKDHPLAAAPASSQPPEADMPQRNWEVEAKQAQAEASFWMMKYFESKQHNDQVIAMLARPQIEQNQRNMQAQQADILSRLTELQRNATQG